MEQLSVLERIRLCFDVSNTSIAQLVGASVDFVKSVSIGRRAWDLKHVEPLLRLDEALSVATPLESLEHAKPTWTTETKNLLSKETESMERQIRKNQEQLERLERHISSMRRGLHAGTVLLGSPKMDPGERKWIAMHHRHLTTKLQEKYWKQLRLKVKNAGLEAELQLLKDYL